jgi:HJR/Mrr/RecB family endonuclease
VISQSLGVGNAGGIRPNRNTDGSIRRLVLLTALPSAKIAAENPYHDRVENDILIYTGKGLRGDQEPGGLNKRLVEQLKSHVPVWCFQQVFSRRDKQSGQNRWKFLGLLYLIRFHRENQIDVDGAFRSVWLFEFGIANEPATVSIDQDAILEEELFASSVNDRNRDLSDVVVEETARDAANELTVEGVRSRLLALHPRDFEFIIKRAFDATGFKDVAVTRYSQDGGIDVVASFGQFGWPVWGWQVQVQAKRWLHTVGRKEVAELRVVSYEACRPTPRFLR